MQYTQEELKEILEKHQKWLNNKPGGQRANLNGANLEGANLEGANLEGAMLNWINAEGINGYTVYAVQMPTSRNNARLSYWKELDIWTTGCFQGSKEKLLEAVNSRHAENEKIRNRYLKTIEFIESMANEEL